MFPSEGHVQEQQQPKKMHSQGHVQEQPKISYAPFLHCWTELVSKHLKRLHVSVAEENVE